jgi:hypothetical protein
MDSKEITWKQTALRTRHRLGPAPWHKRIYLHGKKLSVFQRNMEPNRSIGKMYKVPR